MPSNGAVGSGPSASARPLPLLARPSAVLPRGDVLLLASHVLHYSGESISKESRKKTLHITVWFGTDGEIRANIQRDKQIHAQANSAARQSHA